MTTEDALLAAVWAAPHDDLPRLVYADWLDETGDPAKAARAEFIRVQCELAKNELTAERRGKLERRERDLWHRYRRVFKRGLPHPLADKPFARGFVAPPLLQLSGHRLLSTYAPVMAHAPLWRFEVRTIQASDLRDWCQSDLGLRITELHLHWTACPVGWLASGGRKSNITALRLEYCRLSDEDTGALADGCYPHLHTLTASGSWAETGLKAVTCSSLPTQLTDLNVSGCEIGPAGARALADSSGAFVRLVSLDLSYFKGGDDFIRELTASGGWPRLERLRLFGNALTLRSAYRLADWQGCRTLRHLDLSGHVEIGVEGVRALVTSPRLTALRSLRVFPSNRDRPEVIQLLERRFGTAKTTDDNGFFWLGGEAD